MKKFIYFILATGLLFVFSCNTTQSKKHTLDSFFFVDGSQGPVCWVLQKLNDDVNQKKIVCYDFIRKKILTEVIISALDNEWNNLTSNNLGSANFNFQSGDRLWIFSDSNKICARNIYNWEVLESTTNFEKKFQGLKSGIMMVTKEHRRKGFDIFSNDGKKYFYDTEQLLLQPFEEEVERNFIKQDSSLNAKLDSSYNSLIRDKKYINKMNVIYNDRKLVLICYLSMSDVCFVDAYNLVSSKLMWSSKLPFNKDFVFKKNLKHAIVRHQNGKVLIQDFGGCKIAACFNFIDGELQWTANADSLFKFVELAQLKN